MRCKGVYCVDLGERFPNTIYLQNSASIQLRTSPKKFESSGYWEFELKLSLQNCKPLICNPAGVHEDVREVLAEGARAAHVAELLERA